MLACPMGGTLALVEIPCLCGCGGVRGGRQRGQAGRTDRWSLRWAAGQLSPHSEDAKTHGVRGLRPGRDRWHIKLSGHSTGLCTGGSPFIGQRPVGIQLP